MERTSMLIISLLLAGCSGDDAASGRVGNGVTRLDGAGQLPDGSAATFSDRIDIASERGIYTANRGGKLDPVRS